VTNVVNLDAYRKRSLPEPQRATEPPTVAEAIAICLRHPDILNAWEEGFLVSVRRLPRLSSKQHAVLQRIFDKVSVMAEGETP
jgi:hypothetical protein